MKTIFEAGHFYMSKGYNVLANKGWEHAVREINGSRDDSLMTFIDDVHPIENLSDIEKKSPILPVRIDINRLRAGISGEIQNLIHTINTDNKHHQDGTVLNPHYIEIESGVLPEARLALTELSKLSQKKRPKQSHTGSWFCSDARLTHEDGVTPTCTGYDLGLTLKKSHLGYERIINVLPISYAQQQKNLKRLVQKLLGEKVELVSILYNELGDLIENTISQ